MILEDKVLVLDIDGTICPIKKKGQSYADLEPIPEMLKKVLDYKANGFEIIFFTSRNMRTHQGNVGKINATTLKTIIAWLDKFEIPYDEIHIGKPWAGKKGFYVDDRAVRPSEFLNHSYEEIRKMTGSEDA